MCAPAFHLSLWVWNARIDQEQNNATSWKIRFTFKCQIRTLFKKCLFCLRPLWPIYLHTQQLLTLYLHRNTPKRRISKQVPENVHCFIYKSKVHWSSRQTFRQTDCSDDATGFVSRLLHSACRRKCLSLSHYGRLWLFIACSRDCVVCCDNRTPGD